LALNGRLAEFSLSARNGISRVSFFIGFSMIPAEARWVVQNIYLSTTNCSSFSQLGIKDSLLFYIHIYFCLLYLPFLYCPAGEIQPCSAIPKFLLHNQFFFCCFPRAETKSSYLIIRLYFAVRKLQKVITAFTLVRRKMRCVKQKREQKEREST